VLGANRVPIKRSDYKSTINHWLTPTKLGKLTPKGSQVLWSRVMRDPDIKPIMSAYKRQEGGRFRPSLWRN
jgi:hypothetical protein